MSIEKTSSALTLLQDQAAVSKTSSTSSDTSFQELMSADTAAESKVELTALQLLFRSPTSTSTPASASSSATSTEVESASSNTGTETVSTDLNQEALDPSPAAPWPTTVIRPYPTPELATEAKTAVYAALEKEGVDPAQVKISYWEELVSYPGGNYTNRNITVQSPGGNKIDLDAAYMARCPWLAASAVKELDQAVT